MRFLCSFNFIKWFNGKKFFYPIKYSTHIGKVKWLKISTSEGKVKWYKKYYPRKYRIEILDNIKK